jgi:hypothetical protein
MFDCPREPSFTLQASWKSIGKVDDELIDNYSRDGRFDAEDLRVLVDSLVEMGALKSADVKTL